MKKIINPWLGKPGYKCICCSPENSRGLHLEFWEDGEDIVTYWNPLADYQGWINTLHGGIQAMLMDEIGGWVVTRKLQTTGVTSKMGMQCRERINISFQYSSSLILWSMVQRMVLAALPTRLIQQ